MKNGIAKNLYFYLHFYVNFIIKYKYLEIANNLFYLSIGDDAYPLERYFVPARFQQYSRDGSKLVRNPLHHFASHHQYSPTSHQQAPILFSVLKCPSRQTWTCPQVPASTCQENLHR